jgi:hypothetical protein
MEMIETGLEPMPGVLAFVFAEGEGDGSGFDMGGADDVDLDVDTDVDTDVDADLDTDVDVDDVDEEQQQGGEKVDGRRVSKEFREALKAWEATPEGAKFAKQAREDHFRVRELATLEPGGVTAMREKYALLESVGGAEGITGLQERVAATDAVDEALAAGDPKALESLGPDFDPGLAKLTPTILDRVMKADPEAYSAAILPHLMAGLLSSPMVGDLNGMIDVLQAAHLDDAGKLKAITQLLGRVGQWFEINQKKAGELKAQPVDKQRTEFEQQRSQFEQEKQVAHWNNNIKPSVARFESQKLEELFRPYAGRLKLDAAGKADLFATFQAKMKAAGEADADYMKQMEIYRKMKNPDPAKVINFVKTAIAKHAKNVVDSTITARYGRFIKPKGQQQQQGQRQVVAGARTSGNGGGAPTIVAVRPSPDEIDYSKTSETDQWNGIFTLKSGKVVKVQKKRA